MFTAKKHVDYKKVVEEYYMQNGQAYIYCNAGAYTDVIDSYSAGTHVWPKREFVQYIEENAANIPSGANIVLKFSGTRFSKTQQNSIEQALHNYYSMKLGDSQANVQSNFKKAAILFGFALLSGILLFLYGSFLGNVGILEEVLLVAFWFFLWEGGDVVAFEKRGVQKKRAAAEQLASMQFEFPEAAQGRKVIELKRAR